MRVINWVCCDIVISAPPSAPCSISEEPESNPLSTFRDARIQSSLHSSRVQLQSGFHFRTPQGPKFNPACISEESEFNPFSNCRRTRIQSAFSTPARARQLHDQDKVRWHNALELRVNRKAGRTGPRDLSEDPRANEQQQQQTTTTTTTLLNAGN